MSVETNKTVQIRSKRGIHRLRGGVSGRAGSRRLRSDEDRGSLKEWRWQVWWAVAVRLNRRGSLKGWLDWLVAVLGKSLALRIRLDRFRGK